MHSLATYCIRVHDHKLAGPLEDRYHQLDNIRGNDLVDVIHSFAQKLSTHYILINEKKSKRTFKFTNVIADNRQIYGFTEAGEFGIKGKVVDVKSGTTNYQKKSSDADISELFFQFIIPVGSTIGVCVFHNIHGKGMKSVFLEQFNEHFRSLTGGLVLQIYPVSYMKVVEEFMKKSSVKELRLKQYTPKSEIGDAADKLTEFTSELILKPKKQGTNFGSFWDMYKSSRHNGKNRGAIEVLAHECFSVSAVVEFEGKKRVFSLNENSSPVSTVEFDEEEVKMDQGVPVLDDLKKFSTSLLNDLIKTT